MLLSLCFSVVITLWSSVDVRGRPDFGSFCMPNLPSRKRCAQREIVLLSTVSTPHTSVSELWISVGVFPRNVSILMYARWLSLVTVPETWTASISTLCRFDVHTLPGGETHCTSFQTFSSTTAELAEPMAPLVRRCCQSLHFFWNDLRSNNIPQIMIINRVHENQNLLSL